MNPLKKLLAGIVLTLAIAGVGATVDAPMASAHNADTYSYFYCGATRPNSNMTIYHSSPVDFPQPGWVRYYCYGNWAAVDYDYQWWVDVRVSDGAWVVPFPYQDCDIIRCDLTAHGYGH